MNNNILPKLEQNLLNALEKRNHKLIVEALEAGANPNFMHSFEVRFQEGHRTIHEQVTEPLFFEAIRARSAKIVEVLSRYGADSKLKNHRGQDACRYNYSFNDNDDENGWNYTQSMIKDALDVKHTKGPLIEKQKKEAQNLQTMQVIGQLFVDATKGGKIQSWGDTRIQKALALARGLHQGIEK